MMMRIKRLVLGLMLVAAACGGSDAETASPTAAPTTTIEPATSTTTIEPATTLSGESTLVDDRPLEEQFVEAIRANDGTRIETLVDAGLDVNANHWFGPVMNLIAHTGNFELVAVVVAAGFDLDAQNAGAGRTVLHAAAASGDLELISALVEAGANLEGVDDTQQNTPVQYAFYFGQIEAAKLLISLGADLQYVDITGRNTADLAIKGGFPEAVAFAEELGLTPTPDD